MKVMLINPPPLNYLESYDKPNYGHLGLAYVAASLEKNGFKHNEDLIFKDAKLERLKVNETLQCVKEYKPTVVGLSAYTFDVLYAGYLAKKIKELYPNICIVLGGVHASILPIDTLKKIPEIDITMVGECEVTFPELLKRMDKGDKAFPGIGGVAWREDNKIVFERAFFKEKPLNIPAITRFQNMDDLPFPAWHMIPRASTYQIFTARGCPRTCVFCTSPYGRKFIREMSPDRVIAEMEWVIETFKPDYYRFADETFGYNGERMNQILDIMIAKGFDKKTRFFGSMRADRMTFEILQKMKRANFHTVEVGVETGDPTILKKIKKGETLEETERAVGWVKKAGLNVLCGFIIGHPGETKETAKATIDLAIKLNPNIVAIGLMVPYPGTEIAEYARKGSHGYKLLSSDWSDYNKQYGNALELETLSRKEMERIQALGYCNVYLKNWRILGFLKFIWTYRKAGWRFLNKQLFASIKSKGKTQVDVKLALGEDSGDKFRYLNYRT